MNVLESVLLGDCKKVHIGPSLDEAEVARYLLKNYRSATLTFTDLAVDGTYREISVRCAQVTMPDDDDPRIDVIGLMGRERAEFYFRPGGDGYIQLI